MSILKKPYEISIWEDQWDENQGCFVEHRIAIIGSDQMSSQNRALEPNLVRNVNGTKNFSFKMYKYYIDNETGQQTENKFIEWLVDERKVKLNYKNKWYDFIIKNISENSTNYLYTYQLQDALVQELSKNGFGVVLDEKIRDTSGLSNMGTVKQLAEKTLQGTDWNVQSEVFVEKINETLVYLKTTEELVVTHIFDQNSTNLEQGVTVESVTLPSGSEVLAFYSSCTNKPHRFQFIYSPHLSHINRDNLSYDKHDRVITEKDSQYYIDFSNPQTDYSNTKNEYGLYLPSKFIIAGGGNNPTSGDTTISTWYRGQRYAFVQQSKYIAELDKYVNVYKKDSAEYYGYQKIKYNSPALSQNIISNYKFEGTSGWTGTFISSSTETDGTPAKVEQVCGRWENKKFVSIVNDLQNGTFDPEKGLYKSYLKITFPKSNSAVINSGPFDNRIVLENMEDDWVIEYKALNEQGERQGIIFKMNEYKYNSNTYGYSRIGTAETGNFWFTGFNTKYTGTGLDDDDSLHIGTVSRNLYSKKDFKKNSQVRLVLQPEMVVQGHDTICYLEQIALYKDTRNSKNEIIRPYDTAAVVNGLSEGVIEKTYYYFTPDKLIGISSEEDLKIDYSTKELTYESYIPVYNEGAQKVRSVQAKESNYFNILQSIAETFGAWLEFVITRDQNGGIISKTVKFKNYAGNDNNASFKYGVNLKDVQRTHASNNIVTKLIVKQNANEHAEDGFCTIARANSNPTGENYIYDFQYFHNKGLLKAEDYINSVYVSDNAQGRDIVSEAFKQDDSNIVTQSLINSITTAKDLNNEYCTTPIQWTNDYINTFITDNDETYYTFWGRVKYKLPDGVNYFDINGEPQIGLKLQVYQGTWASASLAKPVGGILEKDVLKINSAQGIIYFELKINRKDLLSSSETGKNSTGIRLQEVRKNNIGEWSSGRTSNSTCINAAWDKYFYGAQEQFAQGLTIYDFELCLIKSSNGTIERFTTNDDFPCNINGYFSRIKSINNYILEENKLLSNLSKNLTKYKAEFEVADVGLSAAEDGIEQTRQDFQYLLGINPEDISKEPEKISLSSENKYNKSIEEQIGCISYNQPDFIDYTEKVSCKYENGILICQVILKSRDDMYFPQSVYVDAYPIITVNEIDTYRKFTIKCEFNEANHTHEGEATARFVDLARSDVKKLYDEYSQLIIKKQEYSNTLQLLGYTDDNGTSYPGLLTKTQDEYDQKATEINEYIFQKAELNKVFYSKYSRFIQEGTWINEEYIDDNKYYTDAQSVLYNSCYPQVAYVINVLELSKLPGYELFNFELGDKTYVEDPKFFGSDLKEQIVITEISENLDDPSKDVLKVQNFKSQFQDLFQKITATVQQVQYSTGSYEKAVALAEAEQSRKQQFLADALDEASATLSAAGQQSVIWGNDGVTIKDVASPNNAIRMIGGAILLSKQDEKTGKQKWVTGITSKGISANLISAGTLNAGEIAIMNYDEPVFKWDAFGLSAYDATWSGNVISKVDSTKFVRFDKFGIYGVNNGKDGETWKPSSLNDENDPESVMKNATFALTWDGLKVTGNDGVVARLGKIKEDDGTKTILSITRGSGEDKESLMSFSNDGALKIGEWIVTKAGLQNGSLPPSVGAMKNKDSTPEVFLMATPVERGTHNFTGTGGSTDDIVFKAGENFMVSESGTLYAKNGIIGETQIGDIASINDDNQNLLLNSAMFSGEGWTSLGYFNYNGNIIKEISNKVLYNNHQTIHIKVTNQEVRDDSPGWNGVAKFLPMDSNSFTVGEKITISCWCKVLDPGTQILYQNRIISFALKGTKSNGETLHSLSKSFTTEEIQNLGGYDQWINITQTFTLPEDLSNTYIAVYVPLNGEAYFADFMVSKGTKSYSWKPNPQDYYNEGVNLYCGPDELNLSEKADQSRDILRDLTAEAFLVTGAIKENQAYYIEADVSGQWETSNDADKKITIGFYSYYDNGDGTSEPDYHERVERNFVINNDNNKLSGLISFPRKMKKTEKEELVLTDRLVIYNGISGRTTRNNLTLKNIKIYKGTVSSEQELMAYNINTNDFSWKFSPTEGMYMWDGPQTNDPVFKIWKNKGTHELYVKGHIVATSGQIGGMTIEAVEALPGAVSTAQQTADTASGKADDAQQTADTASGKADDAQRTADSKMSPSVTTGDYRWTFNSTDGIIMKSGNTEVFKVGNIGTTDNPKSGLSIKGHVEADSGNVGGLEVKDGALITKGGWDDDGDFLSNLSILSPDYISQKYSSSDDPTTAVYLSYGKLFLYCRPKYTQVDGNFVQHPIICHFTIPGENNKKYQLYYDVTKQQLVVSNSTANSWEWPEI